MRTLILLRHAQAVPQAVDGQDFDRPLSRAGRNEAQRSAQRLRDAGLVPDRILASPARRTTETAALLLPVLGLSAGVMQYPPEVYQATAAKLGEAITQHGAGARCLLLVGHNPGLSALAATLLQQPGLSLATAEFRHLQLPEDDWKR